MSREDDTLSEPNGIVRIIKGRLLEIGKDPALFSASSLRNGRIAHEYQRGTPLRTMLRVAGVHTIETAVRRGNVVQLPKKGKKA